MAENIDVRTSLATSKGTTSVADLKALVSTEGVPLALDQGNNPVVVLSPHCCDHHGSRAIGNVRKMAPAEPVPTFATSEHIIMVAGCTLKMANGDEEQALTALLPVESHLLLTYGQVITLGDFYGDPNKPVCKASNLKQQIEQFQKNFVSLQSSAAEVRKILQIAEKYEFRPIADRVLNNQSPSGAYVAMPWTKGIIMNDEKQDFDQATGGGGPHTLTFGRYTLLANTNFDHFGEDAMTCYMAGHILAQQTAVEASRSGNSGQRNEKLKLAYTINAFADHFLTDLFAAGHMRTPRRKLYESALTLVTQIGTSLCAERMHAEDNKFGLWVENKRGDKWVAYGDVRYRDWCNAANRKIMKTALQQSMNDVWNAFAKGSVVFGDNCEVFQYLPKLIKEISHSPTAQQHRDDPRNWTPLFWWNPDDGYNYRRNSLDDVSDRTFEQQGWVSGWGILSTIKDLHGLKGPYLPEKQYRAGGYPYPPNEAGPSGELGWPAEPTSITGANRVMSGVTGPTLGNLRQEDWQIAGSDR